MVCSWPDVQAALCLFRLCICSKFNFFLRLTDPSAVYSTNLVDKLHRLVKLGLSFVIDVTTTKHSYTEVNDKVWQQSTLPSKRGGLSIPDPCRNHIPAYLATYIAGSLSKLQLADALGKINDNSNLAVDSQKTQVPIHELQAYSLRQNSSIQDLFSKFINTYKLENNNLTLEDVAVQSRPQSYLTSFIHDWNEDCIRATWSPEDITRLDSCCHEGGIIVTTIPRNDEFAIKTAHHFRERIRMRLGLPISGCNPGLCSHCEGDVDAKGFHLLSVCPFGNERQMTHNAVRNAVIDLCRHAGLPTRCEDSSLNKISDIDTKKKTDFTCDNFLPGVPITFDTSVTDPRQYVLLKPQPGKAAKIREKSKIKKYSEDIAKAGALFQPFILESFGRWGPITRAIFKQLITRVMQTSTINSLSITKDVITHYWRTRITMAMHRQASLGMHQRIQKLIKADTLAKMQVGLLTSQSSNSSQNLQQHIIHPTDDLQFLPDAKSHKWQQPSSCSSGSNLSQKSSSHPSSCAQKSYNVQMKIKSVRN